MARLAHVMLSHYDLLSCSGQHARVVVYRVMEAVISSMGTVDFPIVMWVQNGTTFRELDKPELDAIKDAVNGWREVERESLNEYFGVPAVPPADMP